MRAATSFVLAVVVPAVLPITAEAQSDDLPRRPYLGAQVAPVPSTAGDSNPAAGVRVTGTIPGAPASGVLSSGDIILSLDKQPVVGVTEFLASLKSRRAGATVHLAVRRDSAVTDIPVVLAGFPRFTGDGFDVMYTSVGASGARRRVIVTKPRGGARNPAVLLLGGIGCYSLDNPLGPPDPYVRILNGLTERGFVTMRVEKPGVGDSEGSCQTGDFDTELAGYVAGAKLLRSLAYVDTARVFLFGHSIGGIADPLVAAQVPVRGVIAIATVVAPWFDYEMENSRRQFLLSGLSGDSLALSMRDKERCARRLLLARETPDAIRATDPACAEHLDYPAHYTYIQQVAALDLRTAWTRVRADVLALYPGADFVTAWHDHAEIAEIVNRVNPGGARADTLRDTDHYFRRVTSMEESFRIATAQGGAAGDSFNDAVIAVAATWMNGVAPSM